MDQSENEITIEEIVESFEIAEEEVESLLDKNSKNPSYLRVADFVYRKLADLSSLTGRYNNVIDWVNRRATLSNAGTSQKLSAVKLLESAVSRLKNDPDASEELKAQYHDAYARCAVELIKNAIELGWQSEIPIAEDEHFKWLRTNPDFVEAFGGK